MKYLGQAIDEEKRVIWLMVLEAENLNNMIQTLVRPLLAVLLYGRCQHPEAGWTEASQPNSGNQGALGWTRHSKDYRHLRILYWVPSLTVL
jgi:hypothetical protein